MPDVRYRGARHSGAPNLSSEPYETGSFVRSLQGRIYGGSEDKLRSTPSGPPFLLRRGANNGHHASWCASQVDRLTCFPGRAKQGSAHALSGIFNGLKITGFLRGTWKVRAQKVSSQHCATLPAPRKPGVWPTHGSTAIQTASNDPRYLPRFGKQTPLHVGVPDSK